PAHGRPPALHSCPTRRPSDLCRPTLVCGAGGERCGRLPQLFSRTLDPERAIRRGSNAVEVEPAAREAADRISAAGSRAANAWVLDRKSTRLNASHVSISYAVF